MAEPKNLSAVIRAMFVETPDDILDLRNPLPLNAGLASDLNESPLYFDDMVDQRALFQRGFPL
jgi:hypothetical protein